MNIKNFGICFIILIILFSGIYMIDGNNLRLTKYGLNIPDNTANRRNLTTTLTNTSEIFLPAHSTTWRYHLDGYDSSVFLWQGMVVTSNNAIFTLGFCAHFDTSSSTVVTEETFHLVKWDLELNQQWNRTIINDDARSMATDGVFIYTNSRNGLQKWDYDGNVIWGPLDYNEYGHIIAADSSGSIYIIGGESTTCGSCIEESRGMLTKISPSGLVLWSKIWSGTGDFEWGSDVQVDEMGYIYTLSEDFIIKWDSDGNQMWSIGSKSYMTIRPDGSFYTLSISDWNNEFNIDFYNNLGDHIWSATDSYLGDKHWFCASVATGCNGGLYILLQESSYGNEVHLLNYDSDGNKVWNQSLGPINWWKTSVGNPDVWIDASIPGYIITLGTDRYNTSFDLAVYHDPSPIISTNSSSPITTTITTTSNLSSPITTTITTTSNLPLFDATFIIIIFTGGAISILVMVLILRKKTV